jgi:predicted transcriptional regulator
VNVCPFKPAAKKFAAFELISLASMIVEALYHSDIKRSTLYDMKAAITIRLDDELESLLDRLCRDTGRTRSDLVRDALRRQFRLLQFEHLRRKTMPFAEVRGYLDDEDVIRELS